MSVGVSPHSGTLNFTTMRGSIKLLTIKGINVYGHWTLLVLLGWALVANIYSGMQLEQILWSLLFLLSVFACITAHELGHALAAAQFGINARNVILFPIGGVASIERLPENPAQELLISLAGPAVSFLLAVALSVVAPTFDSLWNFREYTGVINADNFGYSLYLFNLFLAAFNLIPAFPMDGGRVLRALLGFKFNYVKATAIAGVVGRIIAIILVGVGLATLNLLLIITGLFIVSFSKMEEYYLRLKALVKGIKLQDVLMHDYNSLSAAMTVSEAAGILMTNHSKYFILEEGSRPVGSLNRMEVMKAIAEMKYTVPLKELMKEDLLCLDGERDVSEVLDKLSGNEERLYPVMVGGYFAGVVNFRHIIEYLLIYKATTSDYGRARSLAGLV